MELDEIVYSPTECADLFVRYAKDLQTFQGMGIKSGITVVDDKMIPARPGNLITVLGNTSNYKSGLMDWFLVSAAKQCADNEIVVKVTWEESVEEAEARWSSRRTGISTSKLVRGTIDEEEWKAIMRGYGERVGTNLWIVGHSTMERQDRKRARPRMTMNNIMAAAGQICWGITDRRLKIKFVVLDYLQRMRFDKEDGDSRREQIMESVNKAKDLAVAFGCPVMLGVQTGRDVLERDWKLPQLGDGQESSAIEQCSDIALSVWYPIMTGTLGSKLQVDGQGYAITKNLLILGILKQKLGSAPHVIPLYVDPEKNLIAGIAYKEVPENVYRG